MRRGRWMLWWGVTLPLWAGLGAGQVEIRNGDRLRADFLRQEKGHTVVRPAWGGEAIRIPSRYVDTVLFSSSAGEPFPHLLHLTQGDRIPVEWLGADEDTFRVRTFWGEVLDIPRGFAASLEIRKAGGILFQGPGRVEDWTLSSSSRQADLSEGALMRTSRGLAVRGSAKLQRAVPVVAGPMTLRMEMDRARGPAPGTLLRWGGLLQRRGDGLIQQLQLSTRFITYRLQEEATGRPVDSWRLTLPRVPQFEEWPQRLGLGIQPEGDGAEFTLEINGTIVHTWSHGGEVAYDPEERMELEIHLRSTHEPVFLSRLELKEGMDLSGESRRDWQEGMDGLTLRNGDALEGRVVRMEGSKIHFRTPDLERPIPVDLSRVRRVEFRSAAPRVPRRHARDVRVTALGGEARLTGRLERADREEGLVLHSELWGGSQRLPLSVLDMIRYNPYSSRPDSGISDPGEMPHLE